MKKDTPSGTTDKEVVEQLLLQGYAACRLPIETQVETILEGFKNFLSESKEFKTAWTLGTTSGYIPAQPYDFTLRSMFVWKKELVNLLIKQGIPSEYLGKYEQWCEALEFVNRLIINKLTKIARDLDAAIPRSQLSTFVHTETERIELQHYARVTNQSTRALRGREGEHIHSVLTCCFGGSGLVVRGRSSSQVNYFPGTILIFLGKDITECTHGKLHPPWYEVELTRSEDVLLLLHHIVSDDA